ncbi:MAG: pro-sigmaK processing inhibitor BofA family protein [Bacillota bacterium]|nr:pro-sigmaK processing inhibitor BofA family protein [Bacillota bacterium]
MDYNAVLAYAFGLLLIYVLIRLLFTPMRYALFVLYHAVVGGLILFCINIPGAFVGIHLPLNPISAICAGYLGVPGVILLFALQRVFA